MAVVAVAWRKRGVDRHCIVASVVAVAVAVVVLVPERFAGSRVYRRKSSSRCNRYMGVVVGWKKPRSRGCCCKASADSHSSMTSAYSSSPPSPSGSPCCYCLRRSCGLLSRTNNYTSCCCCCWRKKHQRKNSSSSSSLLSSSQWPSGSALLFDLLFRHKSRSKEMNSHLFFEF